MTNNVGELIKELKTCEDRKHVYVNFDKNYKN